MQIQETLEIVCVSQSRASCRFAVGISRGEIEALADFAVRLVSLQLKVTAVKHVRFALGCSLLEAVTFVEDAAENLNRS
jgi:ribosomal protein L7/L12